MTPIALDGCRAWFYPGTRAAGVVLCNALGIEELCARQSYAILAKMLQDRGLNVLRFDYHGTGDSAGDLNEPDRIARWLRDIEAAASWLEAEQHVTDLTFVGLRFGALLATAAAARHARVTRLALLAPVASGKAFARELQLASKVLVTMGADAGMRHNPGPGTDVAGFVFPPPVTLAMRDVDIAKLDRPPASEAFVATLADPVASDPAAVRLSSLGVATTLRGFDDYARMMINPTSGHPCTATMRSVADWISDRAPVVTSGASTARASDAISSPTWREIASVFPAGDYRCGVLCEPVIPAPGRPCALLLNGGRDSHVGWARGTVELARQLADAGIASFRFDLTHVADSQPDIRGARAKLYAPKSAAGLVDIEFVVSLLNGRGYTRYAVFGSCSGAYLALKAGLALSCIDTIVIRNIQRWVWRLDDRILFSHDERRDSTVGSSSDVGGTADKSTQPRQSAARTAFAVVRRTITNVSNVTSTLMLDRWRVRRSLARFAARGGRVLAIYSARDPGRAHLDALLGKDGTNAGNAVSFEFIEGADHNFSSAALRRRCGRLMIDVITRSAPAKRETVSCPEHAVI